MPTISLVNRRWLITFDHDGRERVTPIDPERFFLKKDELADLIRDSSSTESCWSRWCMLALIGSPTS